jgi:hypothetical protein
MLIHLMQYAHQTFLPEIHASTGGGTDMILIVKAAAAPVQVPVRSYEIVYEKPGTGRGFLPAF